MNEAASSQDRRLLALLDDGDFDGALRLLDARVAAAPPDQLHALRLTRGRVLLALGQPAAALTDFDAAARLAVTDDERGQALIALGTAALDAALPDDARDALESAMALLDDGLDRAEAHRLLARLDVQRGRLAEAVERLSRVLVALSDLTDGAETRAEAALDLAAVLRLTGDARRSRAVLEELLVWAGSRPEWAGRVHFQLGTTLAFEGRFDLAIGQYDLALAQQSDPVDRARTRYNRAVAFRELRDHAAAADDLQAALAENAGRDQRIAADALVLAGIVARERGDMSASLDALRQAIEAAPDTDAEGRARLEVGVTLATTGVHGLAAAEFGAAIELCVDDLDRERAYRYRATTRREMGLPALALDDVTRALELTLDPNERARGAMTRAALLIELDREADAYAALRAAPLAEVTHDAVRIQLAFQLGSLAAQRGDIDLALTALDEALALARTGSDAMLLGRVLVNRGVALDVVGAGDEAAEAFREVVRLAPSAELVYQAWMNLGRLAADRGRLPDALDAFGYAAGAADDRDARALAFLSRGSAAMRGGRYIDADADFTRILVLQPSDPIATQARYYRGLTASLLGQLERARDDLTVTIEQERDRDNRAQALLDRGAISLSAGDFSAAERDLREATVSFRRRAKRAEAHVHLAVACALQGACAAAIAELDEAKRLDPSGEILAAARNDPRLALCREHPEFP